MACVNGPGDAHFHIFAILFYFWSKESSFGQMGAFCGLGFASFKEICDDCGNGVFLHVNI